jgi:isocitrate dehydrogenase
MMLVHIRQTDVATKVHNAWLRTIEDGIHTYDIYREGTSKQKVGTREFAQAVIERLGQKPQHLKVVSYKDVAPEKSPAFAAMATDKRKKAQVGVDVYLDWSKGTPDELAVALTPAAGADLELKAILNRGTRVWPKGFPETLCTDQWRCRFVAHSGGDMSHKQIIDLLGRIAGAGFDFIQTEALCTFDGEPEFSGIPGE